LSHDATARPLVFTLHQPGVVSRRFCEGIAMPRAFIIDDEPGIRLALRRWFERQGYTVDEASSGNDAWTRLSARSATDDELPTVVVCDVNLPGMTGDDLLARVTAARPVLANRFILTTGNAIDAAASDSPLSRHPFVLQKPFDLATLKVLVQRVRAGG